MSFAAAQDMPFNRVVPFFDNPSDMLAHTTSLYTREALVCGTE